MKFCSSNKSFLNAGEDAFDSSPPSLPPPPPPPPARHSITEHTKPSGSGSRPPSGHELFPHPGRNIKKNIYFISFIPEVKLLHSKVLISLQNAFLFSILYRYIRNSFPLFFLTVFEWWS